jgi:LacI family transcriptional regulator
MKQEEINKAKIRIKDIAKKANVSVGTVDRVLHKRGDVNEKTSKKVMDIIDKMGYTPNLLAKTLASNKTLNFAALIPDTSDNNPYWTEPLKGVMKAASEIRDYNTICNTYTFNATNEASFRESIKKLIDSKPEAVVFNPVFKQASIEFANQLDTLKIPYGYIDIDLEQGNNLFYYGQDAKQSGKVAAKIMSKTLPKDATILVVKLTNSKYISTHLSKREKGFIEFFQTSNSCQCKILSVEIDLLEPNEPKRTLSKLLKENADIKGIFAPNSRVFKVAEFLKEQKLDDMLLVGFDLIEQNIKFLENEMIDFLISQKPVDQGYSSMMALFNHSVMKKKIEKINYSPIDIIIKENLHYYIK